MGLREKTVATIVDETRAPNAPIVHVLGKAEQRATLDKFQKDLVHVGFDAAYSPYTTNTLGFHFNIDVDASLPETFWIYNRYHHYVALAFERDVLQLKCGFGPIYRPIADMQHILRVAEAVTSRLKVQWKQTLKRVKIQDLRIRAIELQVLAIAERLDLGWRFQRLHRHLWVCIFDNPWQEGVDAEIPLDEAPHEHIAKFEKDAEEFQQRLRKRSRVKKPRAKRHDEATVANSPSGI